MGGAEGFEFEEIIESAGKRLAGNPQGKKYYILVMDAQIPDRLVGLASDSVDEIMKAHSSCLKKYIYKDNDLGDLNRFCIVFFRKENDNYIRRTLNELR
jgi:chemotaxis signal transduction protein